MSWFTLICLENGGKILPGNPAIDLMLRVAQYKLITAAPKPDKVNYIITRIEETLKEIEIPELKQNSEVLAYGVILNTLEVHIPSSTVIRFLSRMIDLTEDNLALMNIASSFDKRQIDLPRLGENKPVQILFSYQSARLSGLDDLYELVISLDALPLNKRDQLLRICDSDMDFATLLMSRAWWKEVKDGTLDVNKTLRIFDFTATKAREWKVPEITKASLIAMSVVQDEYGQSAERALGILDMADKEFPNDARLINQRAKVLFNAKRDAEALPIAHKALKLPGLSNIEFVFCCRNAGIAAAKSSSWEEAERLFMMGAEKAKHSSFQKRMGIGLTADAAFALWKQKKYKNSLLLFADTLDSLATVTLSEDIRIRYLHASVRHSISWIHFEALGAYPSSMIEPFPGMCSNQEPNEVIKDFRIIDISAAWELLASTETILELDIGIGTRSQKVTGDKKPLIMVAYSRTLSFDRLLKSKDFDNLVPKLIEMLEAVHHTKIFKEKSEDGWAIGDVPKLPDGYWGNSENLFWIYHYILEASVICTADNQVAPLPIERWRTDLTNAGALTDDVNQFLNVLIGSAPDDSIYQQAAASIFKLRSGTLAPTDLWKASFRLLNVFMNEKRWVEKPLEGIIITRWIFAANNQRFAFTSPSLACPEIEKYCLDKTLGGFVKIAAILDIATPYLNINLSEDGKQMIKKIIEKT